MKNKITTLLACSALAVCAYSAENAVAVSSAQFKKVNAKTDVLGRHNPNVRNVSKVYVKKNIKNRALLAKEYQAPNYPLSSSESRIYKVDGEYSYIKNANNKFIETYKWYGQTKTKAEYVQESNTKEMRMTIRNEYANGDLGGLLGFEETTDKRNLSPSVYILSRDYLNRDYIDSQELTNIGNFDNDNDLRYYAIDPNYRGNDIGIYVQQNAIPSMYLGLQYEQLNGCQAGRGGIEKYREMYYASEPIRILNSTSPKAQIYVMDSDCGEYGSITNLRSGARQPSNPQYYDKSLYVGLHTAGRGTNYNYNETAQDIDDYVYFNRVIQIAAAGNTSGENTFISDYAKGANVISVGAIKPVRYGQSYLPNSDWHNTVFDGMVKMEKPEIANFTNIYIKNTKGGVFSDDINQRYRFNYPSVTGTEGAATLTAGMVVDLLDRVPFYKWHPEVVKALLLSASTKDIPNGDYYDNDRHTYYDIATKYPSFQNMIKGNRARFWNGNNADYFQSEKITFQETGIVKDRKYRIAIAWLSRGSYIKDYHMLPQDLDLKICQGNTCKTSESSLNPYEVLDFTATSTEPITVEINRWRNDGGYVLLGYNMHEIY